MKNGFLWADLVGSVPGMINKEVLDQFMYKAAKWTEKLFKQKNSKFIVLCML